MVSPPMSGVSFAMCNKCRELKSLQYFLSSYVCSESEGVGTQKVIELEPGTVCSPAVGNSISSSCFPSLKADSAASLA